MPDLRSVRLQPDSDAAVVRSVRLQPDFNAIIKTMTRRFLAVSVCPFGHGRLSRGSRGRRDDDADASIFGNLRPISRAVAAPLASAPRALALPAGAVSFADIAERLNPAVVNIDAARQAETAVRVAGRRFQTLQTSLNGRSGSSPMRRGVEPAPDSSSTLRASSSRITMSSRAPTASWCV